MTEAQQALIRGAEFGAVFASAPEEEREALRAWFIREASVPNLAARAGGKLQTSTGDLCPRCNGLMVRTGTCLTCQDCGESSGGCG